MEDRQLCLYSLAGLFGRSMSMLTKSHCSTRERASALISALQKKGPKCQEINWPPKAKNHVCGTAQALLFQQAVHSFSASFRAQQRSRPQRCVSTLWVIMWGYTKFWVRGIQSYSAQKLLIAHLCAHSPHTIKNQSYLLTLCTERCLLLFHFCYSHYCCRK